jgi:hypothetical protein
VSLDEEVQAAWGRLTSDSSPVSWIMCGYPEGNNNKIVFQKEGEGGMPEFIENLPAADIAWGAFKVMGVDDRGNTVSRRPKFIFVKYIPTEGVSTMKRARAGGHKGAIKEVLNAHIDFEVGNDVCSHVLLNIWIMHFHSDRSSQ